VAVSEEHQVDAVVWAGDIFHSKAPSRNSHRLVQKVIGIGKAYQRPWYIVPGNHDIQHDQLSSIWDTQPLGVLFKAGAKALIGQCAEFVQLYGVPWQQEWSDENVGEALRDWRESWPGQHNAGLVVTHAPLYPPGMELTYENYSAVMFASAMGNKGSCYYGHVHEYHGTWQAAGVMFCNDGALSRGSLHEHNLTRQVMCIIWDSANCSFTEVPLHAKSASEVFRLREHQEVVDTSLKLDEFLSGVGSTTFEVLSVESVLAHVRTLDVGKDVEDEVAELLDWSAHQQ
jgi:predicted phosphodiesterase